MHRYRLDDEAVTRGVRGRGCGRQAVFVHCGVLTVGVRKKLGLPSPFDLRLGDPLAVAAVALRFPSVPVIIPHFGAGLLREALMAADQCPNIHLDTSSSNSWMKYHPGLTLEAVFRQALAVAGPERLLFGTDSSFFPRGWQRPSTTRRRPRSTRLASAWTIARRSWAAISSGCSRMYRRGRTFVVILCLASFATVGACASQPAVPPATLVLTNGKVVTVEASPAEARAIAITGDRITAVGSDAEIKRYIGAGTEVIDAGGQLVIPGFIESHGHFTGVGEAQLVLKLMNAKTWDEIVAMVANAAKAAKPGQWIYGRGWHQEKWTAPPTPNVEGFPTDASLSTVSPNNPVLLTHASGHASFANAQGDEAVGHHPARRRTRTAARFSRTRRATRPGSCARPRRA